MTPPLPPCGGLEWPHPQVEVEEEEEEEVFTVVPPTLISPSPRGSLGVCVQNTQEQEEKRVARRKKTWINRECGVHVLQLVR